MDPSKQIRNQPTDEEAQAAADRDQQTLRRGLGDDPAGLDDARYPARTTADPATTRKFAIDAAKLCHDDKCTRIRLLDVRNLSQVTDYIVIASGTSERQMRSVLKHIEDLGAESGFRAYRVSTDERAVWLLADFVDVVVHLFEPEARQHYDLEMLWGDAERVQWDDSPAKREPENE